MARDQRDRRIVVLQSTPRPGPRTNPYLTQLFDAVADDVRIVPFGWRAALLGRVDVLHVHWPEVLVRRRRRLHTAARVLLLRLALLRFRLAGVPVVRTLHNLAPHEGQPRLVRAGTTAIDRATRLDIALNPRTPARPGIPLVVIPHSDYLPWLGGATAEPEPGRLLDFGLIRPYKNVPALVTAFRGLDGAVRLEVAGAAPDPAVAEAVRAAAGDDPRVELRLEFQSDDDLRRALGRASLVVLPYAELHNSGAMLLALSAARPVLVPRNEVTDDLAAEVGQDWVLRFDGPLDRDALAAAVAAPRPAGAPRLDERAWPRVAALHVDAYRRAIAAVRHRRYSA